MEPDLNHEEFDGPAAPIQKEVFQNDETTIFNYTLLCLSFENGALAQVGRVRWSKILAEEGIC